MTTALADLVPEVLAPTGGTRTTEKQEALIDLWVQIDPMGGIDRQLHRTLIGLYGADLPTQAFQAYLAKRDSGGQVQRMSDMRYSDRLTYWENLCNAIRDRLHAPAEQAVSECLCQGVGMVRMDGATLIAFTGGRDRTRPTIPCPHCDKGAQHWADYQQRWPTDHQAFAHLYGEDDDAQ